MMFIALWLTKPSMFDVSPNDQENSKTLRIVRCVLLEEMQRRGVVVTMSLAEQLCRVNNVEKMNSTIPIVPVQIFDEETTVNNVWRSRTNVIATSTVVATIDVNVGQSVPGVYLSDLMVTDQLRRRMTFIDSDMIIVNAQPKLQLVRHQQ